MIWGGMGFVELLVMVAFWAALCTGVVLLIAAVVRNRSEPDTASSSALRVLEERYARGEIDRDEFLERRDVLRGSASRHDANR